MSSNPQNPLTSRTARTVVLVLACSVAVVLLVPPGIATVGTPDSCTSFHYVIGGVSHASLPSSLTPGAQVTVAFTLAGCTRTLSFVSYNATSDFSLPPQTVYTSLTGTFGPGAHELGITVPPCYYQLDFVYGAAITQFNGTSGTYHGSNRFIDGSTGGQACETQTTTSTSTTTTTQPSTTTSDTSSTTESSSTTTQPSTTTSEATSSTQSSTTTSQTTSTTESGSTTSETSSATTSQTTTTAQIPFFSSGTTVVLALGGALVGGVVMLRRRL